MICGHISRLLVTLMTGRHTDKVIAQQIPVRVIHYEMKYSLFIIATSYTSLALRVDSALFCDKV